MKKQKMISALVSGLIIVILLAYALFIGETSKAEASIEDENEAVAFDINNLMSFYTDSRNESSTLLYEHNNADDGSGEKINCLSCHDIDTLRELYLLCDSDALEQAKIEMASSNEFCLVCHGSYEELTELTADYMEFIDLENNIANPHEFGGGLNGEHKVTLCRSCHTSVHYPTDALSSAYVFCWDCHHAGVFECYTCHELEEHQMSNMETE